MSVLSGSPVRPREGRHDGHMSTQTTNDDEAETTNLSIADRVEDRDADGPTDAVVVELPKVLACDYTIEALDG